MNRSLVLLTAAFTLLAAEPAWSQPAPPAEVPSELDRARESFVLGLGLSRAEQWPDALAAFQRSARLKPHPVTTYNIAYCERALGRHASAYLHFSRALAAAEGDALSPSYAEQARAYLAEAEPRVARAQVTVAAAGVTLLVDGRPIVSVEPAPGRLVYLAGEVAEPAAPNLPTTFELWLDPGPHVFSSFGPDQPEARQSHDLASGATVPLSLGSRPAPPPVAAAPPAPPPSPTQPPDRRLGLGIIGLGVAGLVAGGALGIAALDYKNELDERKCPEKVCPERYHGMEDDMKALANAATVSLIVGVVGVGVGSYFYFSARPRASGFAVRPRLGLTSVGAEGAF